MDSWPYQARVAATVDQRGNIEQVAMPARCPLVAAKEKARVTIRPGQPVTVPQPVTARPGDGAPASL